MLHEVPLRLGLLLLLPGVGLAGAAPGQDADPPLEAGTILITPDPWPDDPFESPYATDTVDAEQILRQDYRTLPQALRDVPGVLVQETSPGQGSPYLRGFTGYRNLLLVDGIRVNNFVFRAGPNQYWSTVDPLSLARLEVVKGPSSVLFGSDAIGGTVNAITKNPYPWGEGTNFGGELYLRTASAANYTLGRFEVAATADDRWGLLVGTSIKDFGDMHGGDDIGLQRNTGYDEWDGDMKFETLLQTGERLVVAYQVVDQEDVPRTHSTVHAEPFEGTTVGSNLRRDLDQRRELAYVQLSSDEGVSDLFDTWFASLSFQRQEEKEHRTRSSGAKQRQGFEVDTIGLIANATRDTPFGDITFGFDFYHDDVDSFLDKNEAQTPADGIQGPVADDAEYDTLGVFVQDELQFSNDLDIVLGVRYDRSSADADSVRDPVTGERIGIDEDWDEVVGSVRFDQGLGDGSARLFGGVSQGFRAPNLSDLSRFDSARTGEFEVPAPGLDPEHYISYELGVKVRHRTVSAQVAAFYTDIDDQIQRVPTGDTNAAGEAEITKENIGDGWVKGIEVSAAWDFHADWTLFGHATWMDGEVDTYPTSERDAEREPLDRLMPFMTRAGIRWEDPAGRVWGEFSALYADDADELSTRDKNDTSRIPPGGTPDYLVLDLRGGYRISRDLDFGLAVENLTDEDYRVHGSGSNRPGINVVASLRWSF